MPFILGDAGPSFLLSILPAFPNFLIHILVNHVLECILLNVLEQMGMEGKVLSLSRNIRLYVKASDDWSLIKLWL